MGVVPAVAGLLGLFGASDGWMDDMMLFMEGWVPGWVGQTPAMPRPRERGLAVDCFREPREGSAGMAAALTTVLIHGLCKVLSTDCAFSFAFKGWWAREKQGNREILRIRVDRIRFEGSQDYFQVLLMISMRMTETVVWFLDREEEQTTGV